MFNHEEILKNRNINEVKKNFLWMGSLGLIHKGLDLLLEIFNELPDYNLYICGSTKNEPEFEYLYFDELYRTKNIHTYGFVGVD